MTDAWGLTPLFFINLRPKIFNHKKSIFNHGRKKKNQPRSGERIDEILKTLHAQGVELLSTGGTQAFIESLGIPCTKVEDVTSYPSILGGRVKTLHPKVFGGILGRRENEGDLEQMARYEIPAIDLVIVDLYPFEETVKSGASEADIIEKIDIGGISLIRAGAKNFKDVIIVPSKAEYAPLLELLRKKQAFGVSSHYDTAIHAYFAK